MMLYSKGDIVKYIGKQDDLVNKIGMYLGLTVNSCLSKGRVIDVLFGDQKWSMMINEVEINDV